MHSNHLPKSARSGDTGEKVRQAGFDRTTNPVPVIQSYIQYNAWTYWVSKSKDTIGEQAMMSARSLTPLHQRMDCKMRAKMRRRDVKNWPKTPVVETATKLLQSQERDSLVKVL